MGYRVWSCNATHLAHRVNLASHAVAVAFDVDVQELKAPTRGEQDICFARQTAMYLAHVALGMSLGQVARGFGRDRTTARHACKVVEDRRDEPDFDEWVRVMESGLSYFRGLAGLR
jgi:chromosomal replication initiation ATPase DnaA